ncbi:Protein CBG27987 [Caenorhabditis briggsae]|uniref:Uncharacterized protein n=2 Tax=Caenorhabditis briggsae TaxID=6238 RepID=A0AAE9FD42_CAEBR|nr:Protein CBG27987 [Caenorhabditis briggsae]UMM43203.1 hypothetical protein L5515_018778 [Caenorhabditis briggsae]CAS00159.1 Protein CBG27987 [Caenorhabditis briggsae]
MHLSWLIGVVFLISIAHPATSNKSSSSPQKHAAFEFMGKLMENHKDDPSPPRKKICYAYYSKDYTKMVQRCFNVDTHLSNNIESNSPDARNIRRPSFARQEPVGYKNYRKIEQIVADFKRAPVKTRRN